jgi:hypothetical protein
VFIARGKEDVLVTKNMVLGESVYGEKRISVEVREVLSRRVGWGVGGVKTWVFLVVSVISLAHRDCRPRA